MLLQTMKAKTWNAIKLLFISIVVAMFPLQACEGNVANHYSKDDISQLEEVAIQFIEQEKKWNRNDFRVSLRALRKKTQIAIFQGSHKTSLERRQKRFETEGAIRQGIDPDDIVVFIDLKDLTPYRSSLGVLEQIAEDRQRKHK